MFNPKYLFLLPIVAITTLMGCTEDKEEYTATFPEFLGFQAKSLNSNNENVLKAGEPFVVSAIESKQGKHLYQVHYAWRITPADNVSQKYTSSRVYDAKAMTATDTITVEEGGNYRVTLVASYDVAGIGNAQVPAAQRLPNNAGDISYRASALKYEVTLTKIFQVQYK